MLSAAGVANLPDDHYTPPSYAYGNYCGHNWSAGERQPSVVGNLSPIDHLDSICQQHDAAYARAKTTADLTFADEIMIKQLKYINTKRSLAYALALKAQILARHANHHLGGAEHKIEETKLGATIDEAVLDSHLQDEQYELPATNPDIVGSGVVSDNTADLGPEGNLVPDVDPHSSEYKQSIGMYGTNHDSWWKRFGPIVMVSAVATSLLVPVLIPGIVTAEAGAALEAEALDVELGEFNLGNDANIITSTGYLNPSRAGLVLRSVGN